MGVDPIWFAILIAINLQTSFLTPPFGFAIFYLKSVIPKDINTIDIYRGVIPFILIQLITMLLIIVVPEITTWLPNKIFG
jgi:TRAP-type mannitol/chloroaromatic compound transport system permease large subunit